MSNECLFFYSRFNDRIFTAFNDFIDGFVKENERGIIDQHELTSSESKNETDVPIGESFGMSGQSTDR